MASSKKSDNANVDIAKEFNSLLHEQTHLSRKIAEVESEVNEHQVVIETLKKVDGEQKCFKMLGGFLTEQKVKNVLPQLTEQHSRLTELLQKMNDAFVKKSREFNEYKQKHMIKEMTKPTMDNSEDAISRPQKVLV